jgi:hypothetical protein
MDCVSIALSEPNAARRTRIVQGRGLLYRPGRVPGAAELLSSSRDIANSDGGFR